MKNVSDQGISHTRDTYVRFGFVNLQASHGLKISKVAKILEIDLIFGLENRSRSSANIKEEILCILHLGW